MRTLEPVPDTDEEPGAGERSLPATVDWHLLLALFVSFRLLTLLLMRPGGYLYAGGYDLLYYRRLGELSLEGHYPFLDYWLEYPPLFPWLAVGIYRLSLLLPSPPANMFWFQALLSTFLLAFETGNLVLVFRLSREVGGAGRGFRGALVYSGLFMPVFVMVSWFDSFPLFFLLLATWLLVRRRPWLAGAALGLGFMVKIIPAVAAPAALRYLAWRDRSRFALAGIGAALLVALPFLLADSRWLVAGFQATLARSSWETIWALLEGYAGYGIVASIPEHFQTAAALQSNHAATLPWPLINAAFLAACLLLFLRRPPVPLPRALVAAVAVTLNLFLLFSKGYSPQFLVYPLAFVAVLLPNGWGIAYAILLTLDNFAEYPLYTDYFPDAPWLMVATVVLRTLLLCALTVEFTTMLWPQHSDRWQRLRRQIAIAGVPLLVLGVGVAGALLLNRAFTPGAQPGIVAYIRSLSVEGQGLVASTDGPFYALKPYFRDEAFLLARLDVSRDEAAARDRLSSFTAGKPQIWLLLDQSAEPSSRDWLVSWYDRWGSRSSDVWFDTWELIGYLPYTAPDHPAVSATAADFAGQIALDGYELPREDLTPGSRFRLALHWRALRAPDKDYKLFAHLIDASALKVAQCDSMLASSTGASTTWSAGETVRQGCDLAVSPDAQPGEYLLIVGLYDPASGSRLPVAVGSGAPADKVTLGTMRIVRASAP